MKKILELLHESLFCGKSAAVCTAVRTQGSSPAAEKAMMLVLPDGSTNGTIGGGALEFNAKETALQVLQTHKSVTKHYGLSPQEDGGIGMVCGGEAEIAIQFFDALSNKDLVFCAAALNAVNSGRPGEIVQYYGDKGPAGWVLYEDSRALRFTQNIDAVPQNCDSLHIPLNRKDRVCIFGAGHVAKALVPFLLALDFEVTVSDNRPEFADPKAFPGAERVLCIDYAHVFNSKIELGASDYAVVLTHGHEFDNEILKQLLGKPLKYIGCIGSRAKAKAAGEYLAKAGFESAQIDRVHTPVGLEIGAVTPAEIALSIAAEIVAEKRMPAERRN